MKAFQLFFTLLFTVVAGQMVAQCPGCAQFANPYGTGTASPFSTVLVSISDGALGECNWAGEDATAMSIVSGSTYELTLEAGSAATHVTIYEPGGTCFLAGDLPLTFNALVSGDYIVTVSPAGGTCLADNICRNILIECTSCPPPTAVCGDTVCDTPGGEDYCNCGADCMCDATDADIVWISGYETGAFAISAGPIAYCTDQVNTGGANFIPEEIFIPFAPLAGIPCIATWDYVSDFGTTYASFDPIAPSSTVGDGFIALVGLTDADITASGGTVTITFTDPSGNGCTVDKILDLSTLVDFLGNPVTTAAALCPGICGPPTATFDSFDCGNPSADIDITDLGTPTSGSPSFSWDVTDEFGTVITNVPVTTTGVQTFPLPDNNQIYDIIASDGITAGCDVGFFNNPNLYGQCRVPGAGCTDILLEGDFETAPPVAWTQSSVDNTGTPTGFDIIGATPTLAGAAGAWMGGYGNAAIGAGPPFTTTLSQSMVIPSGTTNTIYFWGFSQLFQPADVLSISIDGTPVTAMDVNGVMPSASADLNWREYSIAVPAALADGASHMLTFRLVEQGATADPDGNFQTNFWIDDIMLESCGGMPCPPDFAGGNSLSGPESGMEDYETDGAIESTQMLQSGAQVDYDAGTGSAGIDLNNDFEVQAGAEFDAIIDGCNNGGGGNQLLGITEEQRRMQAKFNNKRMECHAEYIQRADSRTDRRSAAQIKRK